MKKQIHIGFFRRPIQLLVQAFIFLTFLFNSNAFSQVMITKSAPDQDSLVRLVGVKNIDTTYSFQWNEDSAKWELFRRNLHFYNEKHKLLTLLHQDKKGEEWINFDRTIKSYDEKDKLVETLHQEWNNKINDWVNLQLKTIMYNNRGEKTEVLYQQWEKALGEWFSTVRYLIEYNRNGEESSVLVRTYFPATDTWVDHQRYLFYYDDGFGPPDEAIVEKWDNQGKEWKKQGKYILLHNFRGHKKLEIQSTWNESAKKWINGLKYEYDYEKDLLIEQVEYRWDFKYEKWFNALKKHLTYNDKDEVEEELIYRWDNDSSDWRLIQRFLYAQQRSAVPSSNSDQDK